MGKARSSREERLLHPPVLVDQAQHLPSDLDEEEVWSSVQFAASELARCGRHWAEGPGLSSLALDHSQRRRVEVAKASSAPVKVPERRGEEEEETLEWVAPHVLVRQRGKVAGGSSVLEGAGRTLKGRDLSRVRDAVWTNTGFYG